MLKLGKTYKPYGKLAAIRYADGERYYFFVDKHGSFAMMPALMFDPPGGTQAEGGSELWAGREGKRERKAGYSPDC